MGAKISKCDPKCIPCEKIRRVQVLPAAPLSHQLPSREGEIVSDGSGYPSSISLQDEMGVVDLEEEDEHYQNGEVDYYQEESDINGSYHTEVYMS